MDTVRTVIQELGISKGDKKELQENVFVRNNDCVRVVLLIKLNIFRELAIS